MPCVVVLFFGTENGLVCVMDTIAAPTSTDHVNHQIADDLDLAAHSEHWLAPELLKKLASLQGWSLEQDANSLNLEKYYSFKDDEAAQEFANTIGVFLKTNTVLIMLQKSEDRPLVVITMRAKATTESALILCEIADESERKYEMVASCTEDAA